VSTRQAVAVLGGGAWGGVLAAVAARRGHDVALWETDRAAADALAREDAAGAAADALERAAV